MPSTAMFSLHPWARTGFGTAANTIQQWLLHRGCDCYKPAKWMALSTGIGMQHFRLEFARCATRSHTTHVFSGCLAGLRRRAVPECG